MTTFVYSFCILLVTCSDLAVAKRRANPDSSLQGYASEEGVVGAGNYTYYTLGTAAGKSVTLTVSLISEDGDADLYIAGRNHHPTFDLEEHNFQSTTCGTDVITVPAHFVREESPIVIGVYGHPRFTSSKYHLQVMWEPEVLEEKNSYDDNDPNPGASSEPQVGTEETTRKNDFWELLIQIVAFLIEAFL